MSKTPSYLAPVAAVFGISPQDRADDTRCCVALGALWQQRGLTFDDVSSICGISRYAYDRILRDGGWAEQTTTSLVRRELVTADA